MCRFRTKEREVGVVGIWGMEAVLQYCNSQGYCGSTRPHLSTVLLWLLLLLLLQAMCVLRHYVQQTLQLEELVVLLLIGRELQQFLGHHTGTQPAAAARRNEYRLDA